MFSYCLSFLGSFTSLLSLVLLCLSHGIQGLEDHMMQKPECQMWAKLENKTLPLQDQGHANCTTNSDCTGFTCKGIYQVSPVHLLSYSHHGMALFLKDNSYFFATDFSRCIHGSSFEKLDNSEKTKIIWQSFFKIWLAWLISNVLLNNNLKVF